MKLLLAEDEKALVTILERRNYSVDPVYDGQEALDCLECGSYDGVILDIMMPKIDGITVLKRIRNKGNSIPVLLLTAKSEVDDKVEGLDSGANDYLTKPFEAKELLARIRAMTQTTTNQMEAKLQVGNLVLEQRTRTLTSPSGAIRLSGKEYQMMELFMSAPRQIFFTEKIMEKIWGFDSDAELNVVWVYISNLRKNSINLIAM